MVKDLIPENPYDEKILSVWETVNSWGWGKFIPLDECFEKFNVPEGSKLEDRIRNNFIYYRTNYLALYGLLLLITSFSSPLFAVADILVVVAWLLPFVLVPHPFVINEYRITPSCIVAAEALFTVIAVGNSWVFFSFLLFHLVFILLMGLHLVLRNDSIRSRVKVTLNERLKEKIH
ncbi:hypothetical protein WA171_002648 [Blastocystis sp. BT1]